MAKAAWIQKSCNAGIFVNEPTKNANASQIAAVVIFGPTYLSPCETLSSNLEYWVCFSIAFLIINILSTPIAKIKKGITYPLIIVNPIPIYDIKPILESTEAKTIIIPTIERVKPEDILEGNYPIATPI